jgi:hypothetical protein
MIGPVASAGTRRRRPTGPGAAGLGFSISSSDELTDFVLGIGRADTEPE